jgi:hypothetical protein
MVHIVFFPRSLSHVLKVEMKKKTIRDKNGENDDKLWWSIEFITQKENYQLV